MEGGKGVGQLDPSDTTSEFNVRQFQIDQSISKLNTVKLVKVTAVDTSAKEVDVLILVNQIDGDGNKTDSGTIYGLSYGGQQWGDFAFLVDPKVGDIGTIACSDRDISAAKAAKGQANPGSGRQYDNADGIYLGGVRGLNSDPKQSITADDSGIKIDDRNNNHMIFGSTGISINGVLFNQTGQVQGNLPVTGALELGGQIENISGGLYSGNLHIAGTVTADTDVVSGTITLKTHQHNQSGGGTTGPPI